MAAVWAVSCSLFYTCSCIVSTGGWPRIRGRGEESREGGGGSFLFGVQKKKRKKQKPFSSFVCGTVLVDSLLCAHACLLLSSKKARHSAWCIESNTLWLFCGERRRPVWSLCARALHLLLGEICILRICFFLGLLAWQKRLLAVHVSVTQRLALICISRRVLFDFR